MALTSLAGTMNGGVSATVNKIIELSTTQDVLAQNWQKTFSFGTGANQADSLYHDTDTLADAAEVTLDFKDSSLTDRLSEAIAWAKLKGIVIRNNSADAGLILGAAASLQMGIFAPAATGTLIIPPGGIFTFLSPDASGLDVSSNSKLKLEHNGIGSSSLEWDLIAFGVQA